MTERQREAAGSLKTDPWRTPRRVLGVVIWSSIAYLVLVALVSVIPAVFWPEVGDAPDTWTCRDGLDALHETLLTETGARLRDPLAVDRDADWLVRWDGTHAAIESRCEGDAHRSWELLGQLRQRLQGTLERFRAEEGAIARAYATSLESSP